MILDLNKEEQLATFATDHFDFHADDAVGHGDNCLVVADGVSGTKRASGILARALVTQTLKSLQKLTKLATITPIKAADFRAAVEDGAARAIQATQHVGRLDSTLSVVFFNKEGGQTFFYTLGDCKSVIFRERKLVFESHSVVYDFNVPAVVSTNATVNGVRFAEVEEIEYQSGDVCLAFSDGVSDNLFVDEILTCLPKESNAMDCNEVAMEIVKKARATVFRKGTYIPFAVSAVNACEQFAKQLEAAGDNPLLIKQFANQCKQLPSRTNRNIFQLEKIVKQLNFYSMNHLLQFARKSTGKEDDISVAVALIH